MSFKQKSNWSNNHFIRALSPALSVICSAPPHPRTHVPPHQRQDWPWSWHLPWQLGNCNDNCKLPCSLRQKTESIFRERGCFDDRLQKPPSALRISIESISIIKSVSMITHYIIYNTIQYKTMWLVGRSDLDLV